MRVFEDVIERGRVIDDGVESITPLGRRKEPHL